VPIIRSHSSLERKLILSESNWGTNKQRLVCAEVIL